MKKNTLLWLIRANRRWIPSLLLLTASQVGHAVFGVLFALGSRAVIDSAVSAVPNTFRQAAILQCCIILGIVLCAAMTRHMRERLLADMDRDWKQKLLHGLLHGEYAAVSAYHSAELLNRLNNDVKKINDGVVNIVPRAAGMVTRLIAALAVLGVLDWKFTFLAALLGIIVISSTTLMRKRLKTLNKQVSEHDGKVSGFLQELIEKLLMVQAMDVAQEVERRAAQSMDARYEMQRKKKNISLFANTSINILYYSAGYLALLWCGWRLLCGEITFGSLTAVIQLVNQLQTPFADLSGLLPMYLDMVASAERIRELESIQGEPDSATEDPDVVYSNMKCIEAEGLTFSYDRDRILEKSSFCVPKGAFTVITGPSGIGKSTLLKLLLGIFQPEEGKLYLTGADSKILLDRSTRKLFSYVPQGNLLLSGSLRDNITIAAPHASEAQLQEAIHASCMDNFLCDLPQGLDTQLGENGAGLSEGQIQRIAIARAVVGGAPILLLDECTSALDEKIEQQVLLRLKSLPNRTCIAVTHRPAAIEICDYRLEVQKNRVKVVGNGQMSYINANCENAN